MALAVQSMKHEEGGDIVYLKKRHRLIPIADSLMTEQFKGRKNVTREERDYAFHRHMVILAIKEGISEPGNLELFDAKSIPNTQFTG